MTTKIKSILILSLIVTSVFVQEKNKTSEQPGEESSLVALGTSSNPEILESSGLARSAFVENGIWTLNDSGNANKLFLLKHDGKLLAKIELERSKNVDWEAMARFTHDEKSYLIAADVGDNLRQRKNCQLYLVAEPDLSAKIGDKPIEAKLDPIRIDFAYEDIPKNCEAVAVNEIGKQIWLVEKVYYTSKQKESPGIYVLPMTTTRPSKPLVAKRIADFPIRNVTGMDFSPDGKRLIIRNYVNAHLYSREEGQTWPEVVSKTKPQAVVLPLQRQGEAICFSADSNSVIVTSELNRQIIWQVGLEQYFKSRTKPKSTK
ncbi:MAG: hypothetical protein AB8B55_16390 [Mariniblastus sp.]